MDHPVRTLLYELFVEPSLRLLQRLLERKVNARPTKNAVEDDAMKDDTYPRIKARI